MATEYPEPIEVPIADPVELLIHASIDRLIFLLNQRTHHLITSLRDRQDEIRANQAACQQMQEEIVATQRFVEGRIKHNKLHTMQHRLVKEMEDKLAELRLNTPPHQELTFLCDTQGLEERIALLGEIVQHEIPPVPTLPAVPNYAALKPTLAFGRFGSATEKLQNPRSVTIEPGSGDIYVADKSNSRIQIFSQTGHHIDQFGRTYLKGPRGIALHQSNIYVTDMALHALFLFELPQFNLIKRVGKKGFGRDEFNSPKQLAMSPDQYLYVADYMNDRVQILSRYLVFISTLQHQSMTRPVDVKFSDNEIFVLSVEDNPCIHVFSLSGEKSRSLITSRSGMQVVGARYFCLDGNNNILISDLDALNIKVFSREGHLLHTIGQEGDEPGKFFKPNGIAIHNSNSVICISNNFYFTIQIFSA